MASCNTEATGGTWQSKCVTDTQTAVKKDPTLTEREEGPASCQFTICVTASTFSEILLTDVCGSLNKHGKFEYFVFDHCAELKIFMDARLPWLSLIPRSPFRGTHSSGVVRYLRDWAVALSFYS